MYAVIKAGGKQHKVKTGDVIEVEHISGGGALTFSPLLVVDDDGKAHVGKDLAKATVRATPVGEQKGEKVKVFKYRAKTGYAKRQGHRQLYTLVRIDEVSMGRRAAAKKATEPAAEEEAQQPEPEAAEARPRTDAEGEVEGAAVDAAAPADPADDDAAAGAEEVPTDEADRPTEA